jgi:hypothetical protein
LGGLEHANAYNKQELFTKSGLERQVGQIPAALALGLEQARQQGAPVDAKFLQAWAEAVPNTYKAEKLLTFIDEGLQKLLTPEDERALLAHYNSPLGRRITALEIKNSDLQAKAEAEAYAQKLLADPSAHADRLARYQEIDKAVGGTTMAVEMAMGMQLALQVGMISAMNGPKDFDIPAIKAALEKTRFAVAQQIASMVLTSFAYTYRDLSNKELNAYLTFLNSPAGKKFSVGISQLLSDAMTVQAQELGRQLIQTLERKGI